MLQKCIPGLPAAKIPNWQKDLKQAYIIQVNGITIKNKQDIINNIEKCRRDKLSHVKIMFSTMLKQGLHPQHGVPQLYHGQMNIIAKHIFDIHHLQRLLSDINDTPSQ